jgi:hypothetical protein
VAVLDQDRLGRVDSFVIYAPGAAASPRIVDHGQRTPGHGKPSPVEPASAPKDDVAFQCVAYQFMGDDSGGSRCEHRRRLSGRGRWDRRAAGLGPIERALERSRDGPEPRRFQYEVFDRFA